MGEEKSDIVRSGEEETSKELDSYPLGLQYAEAITQIIRDREPDTRGYYKIEMCGPDNKREVAIIRQTIGYVDGVGANDWITRGSTGGPAEVELKFEQDFDGRYKIYPTDEEMEEKDMTDIVQTIRELGENEGSRISVNNDTVLVSHKGQWHHREDVGDGFKNLLKQLDDAQKGDPSTQLPSGTPS